jgi:hypothetical protein
MICNWRLIPGNPVVASNTKKVEKGDTTTLYRQQKIKLQKLPNKKLVNPQNKGHLVTGGLLLFVRVSKNSELWPVRDPQENVGGLITLYHLCC